MAMSKKDYIRIADNFHYYLGDCAHVDMTVDQMANMLASFLVGTNPRPRFDRGRFVRRCMQGCSDSEFAKRQRKAKPRKPRLRIVA